MHSQKIKSLACLFPLLASTLWVGLNGCGNPGESLTTETGQGPFADIGGSIGTQSGRQRFMQGWAVALFDKEYQVARVSEVDEAGIFNLRHVFTNQSYTLAVFNPEYILTAVLSLPSRQEQFVHQYFNLDGNFLPKIVYKSQTLDFQTDQGIIIDEKSFTSDVNLDLIPDEVKTPDEVPAPALMGTSQGFANQAAFPLAGQVNNLDTDLDRIPNSRDSDLDGLGLLNTLDPDDDNDSIPDPFDLDANGDNINDEGQDVLDNYFKIGVEWIAVSYEKEQQTDGSSIGKMTFATKVRDKETPSGVQVRGPKALLEGAKLATDLAVDWDTSLVDDGNSSDGRGGDRIFARQIQLPTGKAPLPNQAMFIQLRYGDDPATAWFREYPFVFPNNITLRDLVVLYIDATIQFNITQEPFALPAAAPGTEGLVSDFYWSVSIFDATGESFLFDTERQNASTTSYALSAEELNQLENGVTYQYQVSVQTLSKVPSYPTFIVRTAKTSFTISKLVP